MTELPGAVQSLDWNGHSTSWFDDATMRRVDSRRIAMETAGNPVLYDDQCSFCVAQMRILKRLDWFGAIRPLPMSSPFAAELVPHLSREQLLEAIRCVAKDGRVYSGVRCFRYIGMRIPLLVPLAIILWLPGAIWIGDRIYRYIARNRYLISRLFGCDTACAISPNQKTSAKNEVPPVVTKP